MSPRIATHQIDEDGVAMCIRSAFRGFPRRREIRMSGSRCVEEKILHLNLLTARTRNVPLPQAGSRSLKSSGARETFS